MLGNHDAHLLDVHAGLSKKALHHAEQAQALEPDDWKYLDQLPLWLDLPELNVLVVHAGLIPSVELARQPRHVLLNMRSIDAEGHASMRVDGGVPWATRAGPARGTWCSATTPCAGCSSTPTPPASTPAASTGAC